jgi:hypothetical protein
MKDSISNLKVTRDAAAILGAVTSATVVFALVYYPALEAFNSPIVAYILGGFSVALVLFIVDYGLRTDLAYGLDLAFSSKLGRKTRLIAFLALFLLFNGARALVSMALSWEGRKDVAAAAIKAPELQDVAAAKLALDRESRSKLSALEKQIAEIQKAIKAAEAGAGSGALRSLAASGTNGWARGELAKARARASKAHRATLAELQATYTAILKSDALTAANAVSALSESNHAKQERYETISKRSMGYVGYLGAGATVVVIITSILLALINKAEQDAPSYYEKHRTSGPPNVAPAGGPASAPGMDFEAQRVFAAINSKLERMGEQQAGNTGNNSGVTPEKPKARKSVPTSEQKKGFSRASVTREQKNLSAKIKVYKRRQREGTLSEHGEQSLKKWEQILKTMKNKKA